MTTYQTNVIRALQRAGKTYEWSEWALSRLDIAHYQRKYTAQEFAIFILAYQSEL